MNPSSQRIYIGFPLNSAARAELQALVPDEELWFASADGRTAADERAWAESEIALGAFTADELRRAPALRWVQYPSVGVEEALSIDWTEFADRLVCTNLRGVYAEPMAQTVLAGLLALCRGLDGLVRDQREHAWRREHYHARLRLLGGRVLLLGHGSVNRRVEELLARFGCEVTVFARTSGGVRSVVALDEALAAADIVVAALPDTDGTRGLLDARRIGLLPPGALLANVGRGSLLDEGALTAALQAGRLGGALLDVTREEPLSAASPLWDCPRLILTQHTSAGSDQVWLNLVRFFADNLSRYRRSAELRNRIDWTRGY